MTEESERSRRLARSVRAITIASRFFEQVALEVGVSLPQYRLMLWIRHGPRRAAELAERVAVRRPTITALVDGLAEQGFLRRGPVAGDRRGVVLELTQKGLEALDAVEEALGEQLACIGQHGDEARVLDGLDELATLLEVEIASRAERGAQ